MNSLAKKINYKGKFVKVEINKEIESFWDDIKNNFTENKKVIINEIGKWREENSVSIHEFCKKIDMTPRQYYRIINEDENITLMSMVEIARFLGYKLEIKFKK